MDEDAAMRATEALWAQPHPNDGVFNDVRSPAPGLPKAAIGVQARAAIAIHDKDGKLIHYERTPWEVVKTDFRTMMMRFVLNKFSSTQSKTYTDIGGAARTFNYGVITAGVDDLATRNNGNNQVWCAYGDGTTTPTAADNDLTGPTKFRIDATVNYDDTNFIVTLTAARTHVEAAVTAAEIACGIRVNDVGSVLRTLLIDHASVAPTPITTGATVTITYQCLF